MDWASHNGPSPATPPLPSPLRQAVANAHLFPPLLRVLGSGGAAAFEVRREAAWAVANALAGGTALHAKCATEGDGGGGGMVVV